MPRQISPSKSVALLATGDEIVQGDILNSNSQQIALRLTQHNISVGTHLTCNDNIDNIEHAIKFLLHSHQALVITGGLGPTSDDLTRYGLSKAINRPLVFDESSWENICQRLIRFGYHTPPESNRQQALFPQGAAIIPNANGTAAGCQIAFENQLIFMLPGPPDECLPLVDEIVLPALIKTNYPQQLYRKKWLLFGVSEAKIAEQLDQIVHPSGCITGYRICYPYLECKILSSDQKQLTQLLPQITSALAPHLIGNGQDTVSEQLKLFLATHNNRIGIDDSATGGLLESIIKTPFTQKQLYFATKSDFPNEMFYVALSGLTDFWQDTKEPMTHLELELHSPTQTKKLAIKIPLRSDRVKLYATEWACGNILSFIADTHSH
jgi:nicotinamide-nucleotide amidase